MPKMKIGTGGTFHDVPTALFEGQDIYTHSLTYVDFFDCKRPVLAIKYHVKEIPLNTSFDKLDVHYCGCIISIAFKVSSTSENSRE